ncbi:hypothetical protein RRG08_027798 [Elysia crispata]|uniref:SCP domain-containing protein n=1 Tax=Elysia crispata TaxID=231223 RepID=A0AAE0Z9K6_9GAST|nr:hypothetical protein RRG08_027798 [Elysia crispata]
MPAAVDRIHELDETSLVLSNAEKQHTERNPNALVSVVIPSNTMDFTTTMLKFIGLLFMGFTWIICSAENIVTYTEAGVMMERGDAEGQHRRFKREVNHNTTGFNWEEQRAMLLRHNNLRSTRLASNMMFMEWDDRLAESAQKWAEVCDFRHSDNQRDLAGFKHVGENLYAGTHKFDPTEAVQSWYDEIKYYDYKTRKCSGICGHYTQVVWATSRALGCGIKYCPYLKGSKAVEKGYNVVCHYGPGGNYVGQRPYSLGEPCSKCPITSGYCVQGMCSKRPKIGFNAGEMSQINMVVFTVSVIIAVLKSVSPRWPASQ